MLRTGFVLVVALAALQAHAQRTLVPVESSFELRLADTSLPAGAVGDVSFKTCDKCAPMSRVLTPSTQFFVGTQPVTAASFMPHGIRRRWRPDSCGRAPRGPARNRRKSPRRSLRFSEGMHVRLSIKNNDTLNFKKGKSYESNCILHLP